MPTRATELGWRGEERVRTFLERRGWTLLQRNFRTREGEIDLIMKDRETLVFVEVKTRRSRRFGAPEEAVTTKKLERMFSAAERYLQEYPEHRGPIRFDLVVLESTNGKVVLRHLRSIS